MEIKDLIIIGHSYGGMIGTKLLQSADLEIKSIINLEGNLVEEDCGESINVANMTFSKFQDYFELLKVNWRTRITSPIYLEVSHSPKYLQKYFIKPQKLLLIGQNQVTCTIYFAIAQYPNY